MPDHKFLQELEHKNFEPWPATPEDIKEKNQDEEFINDSLEQRAKEEGSWKWAASRWNLLFTDEENQNLDPNVSNVLLPFIRMIASTLISSLAQAHRNNRYKPRQRTDDSKALLWQAASDHVDNACGMQNELDDFYTNFVVLGNSALEDYVHLPHISKRYKQGGEWKSKSVRDFSRSRIGTRSRSPFECGYWTGTKDPNERTPVFTRDKYSYNEFLQEFANVYLPDGTPKYENCKYVQPGHDCFINEEGAIDYEEMDHNGVSVIGFQDPIRDMYRLYANGVRIQNIPLHEYNRIQKTTLSFARNNHKFDSNFRVTSAYGYGEAHLLRGLDALYQAIGNLNIDNYKLANQNVLSVRSNNGVSALEEDFDYLPGVRVEGDVIVSPLGSVRLGDYSAFKEMIDQWAIWLTKVNFQQLVGDTSKTAFELQQRIKASSEGVQYKMTKLAAGCFRKHAQNRLSFILSDMTVEEYLDLDEAEIPMIQELLKKNKAPKEDYQFTDGLPTKRVMRERVKVKNRDIKENYSSGKRSIDDLEDKGKAQHDSDVTVTPEYFWPVEYIESGAVPDIEVEVDLGAERELRFQKMQFISNYARQRISEAALNPQVAELQTRFDGQKIDEELVRSVEGITKEAVMTEGEGDQEMEALDETITEIEKTLSPLQNGMAQTPVQQDTGIQNVDAQGLGSFDGQPNPAANPVNAAERGALGAS
ncbi:hypothetical protein [Caudoviricetes sp.]|nr:hypothetical protein [Caudoviricetes sp.]